MSAENGLTPEQEATARALRDMLNAYDAAPQNVQDEMRQAVRTGDSEYKVPQEYMEIGRAATTIQEVDAGKTTQQAIRDAQTLREAGQKLPGVRQLFRWFARRNAPQSPKK